MACDWKILYCLVKSLEKCLKKRWTGQCWEGKMLKYENGMNKLLNKNYFYGKMCVQYLNMLRCLLRMPSMVIHWLASSTDVLNAQRNCWCHNAMLLCLMLRSSMLLNPYGEDAGITSFGLWSRHMSAAWQARSRYASQWTYNASQLLKKLLDWFRQSHKACFCSDAIWAKHWHRSANTAGNSAGNIWCT